MRTNYSKKGAKRGQELKLALNGETKLPFVGGGLEGWNNPVKKQLEESDGSDKCFPWQVSNQGMEKF